MSKFIAKTVKSLTLWTTKRHWCGCRDTWGCEAMRKPIGVCRERKTNFRAELIYDIAYSSAWVSVSRRVSNEHKKRWDNSDGPGHDKRMLRESSRSPQADALSMKRKDLRKEVGFLTGHYFFYGRLHRVGIRVVPLRFRECRDAEETAKWVFIGYPASCLQRSRWVRVKGSVGRTILYDGSQDSLKSWDFTACKELWGLE